MLFLFRIGLQRTGRAWQQQISVEENDPASPPANKAAMRRFSLHQFF